MKSTLLVRYPKGGYFITNTKQKMTTRLTHNWQDSKNNVSLTWHLHPVRHESEICNCSHRVQVSSPQGIRDDQNLLLMAKLQYYFFLSLSEKRIFLIFICLLGGFLFSYCKNSNNYINDITRGKKAHNFYLTDLLLEGKTFQHTEQAVNYSPDVSIFCLSSATNI